MKTVVLEITDANMMVVSDSRLTEGKAWIELGKLGMISLNEGFIAKDFNSREINKKAEVLVNYEGELTRKNIQEIRTATGTVVYKSHS